MHADIEIIFFEVMNNNHMDKKLIFAVMTAKMKQPLIMKCGKNLNIFIRKQVLANIAWNDVFDVPDYFTKLTVIHNGHS